MDKKHTMKDEKRAAVSNPKSKPQTASQARPGLRRVLVWSVRSGKLMALVVLGIAGWLLYDALTSPEYVVRSVSAQGITALSEADVEELADVTGKSIWFVRDIDVESRVRQSPYVERVRAQVMLPGTVVVQVKERRPEVRWTHEGATYAVTWEGLVLAGTPQPAAQPEGGAAAQAPITDTVADVPAQPAFVSSVEIIDTTPNRTLKAGDIVDPDALEVARRISLRRTEIPAPIHRIEWDAGMGVSLRVADDKQVVIGKNERLDEKLAIIAQLLHDSTPFSYLDLRTTTPFYR